MPRLFAIFLFLAPASHAADLDPAVTRFVETHCLECHDSDLSEGDLDLTAALDTPFATQIEPWEDVARLLRARQMPPQKHDNRPAEPEYAAALAALVRSLDAHAAIHPQPGRTETVRRLTRTEYQNAVRGLLAIDIDAADFLPADPSSHGFDNVTVGTLPATLLDRYITAAQKIARLAVGSPQRVPNGDTFRIKPDITQEHHVPGLPFGTRGGALIPYTFPREGEYEITVRLARDRNDTVEGLRGTHEMVVLLDRKKIQSFKISPPEDSKGHHHADAHLKFRTTFPAGPHDLGVTFLKAPSSIPETKRQPYESRFNFHRHPRSNPAVFQVSVTGPFTSDAPGKSPSREKIFVTKDQDGPAARQVVASLLRKAWRRPVTGADVDRILPVFYDARQDADFDTAIEAALSAILVSREFLFRVEDEPDGLAPGTPYPVGDIALASRLSFFLWSSIPDDGLLTLAEQQKLSEPATLAAQATRMLADPRASSLVTSFAAQWLHLKNLDAFSPDGRLFPDFDDNLRQAFRKETELLFQEMVRDDRSILSLLKSDHAYLNERLAKHYNIPHVYGTHFRPVALDPEWNRGGLLRHGSVLTVTSYATRTSPVIRGKWILENILGTPPPPPAPDVPALEDNTVSAKLPIRERLAAHSTSPACSSCHVTIDPPGFALENYDAIGRWRTLDGDNPVDATGGLPDGSEFVGVDGLEQGLLARPELFATALTEKLLTFALGRGVEYSDAPAVRKIVRHAAEHDYRFSAIITAIAQSQPFTQRQAR